MARMRNFNAFNTRNSDGNQITRYLRDDIPYERRVMQRQNAAIIYSMITQSFRENVIKKGDKLSVKKNRRFTVAQMEFLKKVASDIAIHYTREGIALVKPSELADVSKVNAVVTYARLLRFIDKMVLEEMTSSRNADWGQFDGRIMDDTTDKATTFAQHYHTKAGKLAKEACSEIFIEQIATLAETQLTRTLVGGGTFLVADAALFDEIQRLVTIFITGAYDRIPTFSDSTITQRNAEAIAELFVQYLENYFGLDNNITIADLTANRLLLKNHLSPTEGTLRDPLSVKFVYDLVTDLQDQLQTRRGRANSLPAGDFRAIFTPLMWLFLTGETDASRQFTADFIERFTPENKRHAIDLVAIIIRDHFENRIHTISPATITAEDQEALREQILTTRAQENSRVNPLHDVVQGVTYTHNVIGAAKQYPHAVFSKEWLRHRNKGGRTRMTGMTPQQAWATNNGILFYGGRVRKLISDGFNAGTFTHCINNPDPTLDKPRQLISAQVATDAFYVFRKMSGSNSPARIAVKVQRKSKAYKRGEKAGLIMDKLYDIVERVSRGPDIIAEGHEKINIVNPLHREAIYQALMETLTDLARINNGSWYRGGHHIKEHDLRDPDHPKRAKQEIVDAVYERAMVRLGLERENAIISGSFASTPSASDDGGGVTALSTTTPATRTASTTTAANPVDSAGAAAVPATFRVPRGGKIVQMSLDDLSQKGLYKEENFEGIATLRRFIASDHSHFVDVSEIMYNNQSVLQYEFYPLTADRFTLFIKNGQNHYAQFVVVEDQKVQGVQVDQPRNVDQPHNGCPIVGVYTSNLLGTGFKIDRVPGEDVFGRVYEGPTKWVAEPTRAASRLSRSESLASASSSTSGGLVPAPGRRDGMRDAHIDGAYSYSTSSEDGSVGAETAARRAKAPSRTAAARL